MIRFVDINKEFRMLVLAVGFLLLIIGHYYFQATKLAKSKTKLTSERN